MRAGRVSGCLRGSFEAFPDLQIEVKRQQMTNEAVNFEVVLRGTHRAGWRGIPGTGRRVEIGDCAVVLFDASGKLVAGRGMGCAGTAIPYRSDGIARARARAPPFYEPDACAKSVLLRI